MAEADEEPIDFEEAVQMTAALLRGRYARSVSLTPPKDEKRSYIAYSEHIMADHEDLAARLALGPDDTAVIRVKLKETEDAQRIS